MSLGIQRIILFSVSVLIACFAIAADSKPLRMATTTSIKSSGLLDVLVEGDSKLDNPYSLIKINPARHAGINFEGAKAFSDWLQSQEGRRLILNHRVDGEQLYFSADVLQE